MRDRKTVFKCPEIVFEIIDSWRFNPESCTCYPNRDTVRIRAIDCDKYGSIASGVCVEINEKGANFFTDGSFESLGGDSEMFEICNKSGDIIANNVLITHQAFEEAEKALGIIIPRGRIVGPAKRE